MADVRKILLPGGWEAFLFPDGRIRPVIRGGAGEEPDPKPDPAKDDDLGDGGKKALDRERQARREAERKQKELEDRLAAIEDKDKSEVERLTAKVTEAEKRAAAAEAKVMRFEVAADKGVKARWLTGDTREELEAAADEYLQDHPTAGSGAGGGGGGDKPPAKPKENLSGGSDPTDDSKPAEMNPAKLAESVPRGF